jgi:hypothetical protein
VGHFACKKDFSGFVHSMSASESSSIEDQNFAMDGESFADDASRIALASRQIGHIGAQECECDRDLRARNRIPITCRDLRGRGR